MSQMIAKILWLSSQKYLADIFGCLAKKFFWLFSQKNFFGCLAMKFWLNRREKGDVIQAPDISIKKILKNVSLHKFAYNSQNALA